MEEKKQINFKSKRGVMHIFPEHYFVCNWQFDENEEEEAVLANALAIVAEKNGLSINDISHLFPYVLRILKSNIEWSK